MSDKKNLTSFESRNKAAEDNYSRFLAIPANDLRGSAFKGSKKLNSATEVDIE